MEFEEMGWSVYRPVIRDIDSVLSLMRAFDVTVTGEPDTDLDDLKHAWAHIDLAQDAWVVADQDEEIIGYAAVLPNQTDALRIDVYTQPDLIETDLPSRLLTLCLTHANELGEHQGERGIKRLVAYVVHTNLHYRELFEDFGFRAERYVFQMQMELPSAPAAPIWPEGIKTRAFQPGNDDHKTYELIQDAFERPGHERYSFEQWKGHMLRPGSFNPELWILAFAENQLVGVCLAFDYPQEGWVRQLAVCDAWRGKGLGSALLRNTFSIFYNRDKHRVGLTTESDNPEALTFYKRLGMTLRRQYDEYIKPLSTGDSGYVQG